MLCLPNVADWGDTKINSFSVLLQVSVISLLMCSCTTYQSFSDVPADELNTSTLRPGHKLQLEYYDGSIAKFKVLDLTETTIISTDGMHWPKEGISTLKIKRASHSLQCQNFLFWMDC
jgi:hypothetical protein